MDSYSSSMELTPPSSPSPVFGTSVGPSDEFPREPDQARPTCQQPVSGPFLACCIQQEKPSLSCAERVKRTVLDRDIVEIDTQCIQGVLWKRSEVIEDSEELFDFVQTEIYELWRCDEDAQKESMEKLILSVRFLANTLSWAAKHMSCSSRLKTFLNAALVNCRSLLLLNLRFPTAESESSKLSLEKCVFHTYLEILWSALEFSVAMEPYLDCLEHAFGVVDICSKQVFSNVLHEVVFLVASYLTKITAMNLGSGGRCNCAQELWVLVHSVVKEKGRSFNGSFWGITAVSLDAWFYLDESDFQRRPNSDEIYVPFGLGRLDPDKAGVCFAVILSISEIISGFQEGTAILDDSGEDMMKRLLQYSLSLRTNRTDWELKLRKWLPLVSKLISYSNGRIRQILFEHFWKVLYDQMSLPSVDAGFSLASTVQIISKTSCDWLERVQQYRLLQHRAVWRSWDCFLQMVASVCKSTTKASNVDWNLVRSKTLAQMTARRLQEFSLGSLYDCLSLFLVIAKETSDLSRWVSNVLRILTPQLILSGRAEKDVERVKILWRFLGALILTYVDFKESYYEVGVLLAKSVARALEFFDSHSADRILANHLMGLFSEFTLSLNLIVSAPGSLCEGMHSLIDFSFEKLLSVFPRNSPSLSELISTLVDMTEKLLLGSSDPGRAIPDFNSIRVRIVPAVLRLWGSGAGPEAVPVFAANVVQLDFLLFRKYDVLLDVLKQCGKCSSGSLLNFLSLAITTDWALGLPEAAQDQVISSWYRCVLLETTDSVQLNELSQKVFRLSSVQNTANCAELAGFPGAYDTCSVLFQSLETVAGTAREEKAREKMKLWFGNTVKILQGVSDIKDSRKLIRGYKILGSLVLHCSTLLYTKPSPFGNTEDALLTEILSYVQSNSVRLRGVRACLSEIIGGILKLSWEDDNYLRRKLKEIFLKYAATRADLCSEREDHILLEFVKPSRVCLRSLFLNDVLLEKHKAALFRQTEAKPGGKKTDGEAIRNLWLFYEQMIPQSESEDVLTELNAVLASLLLCLAEKDCCDRTRGQCRSVLTKIFQAIRHLESGRVCEIMKQLDFNVFQELVSSTSFDRFLRAVEIVSEYMGETVYRQLFIRMVLQLVENCENKTGRGAGSSRHTKAEKLRKLLRNTTLNE